MNNHNYKKIFIYIWIPMLILVLVIFITFFWKDINKEFITTNTWTINTENNTDYIESKYKADTKLTWTQWLASNIENKNILSNISDKAEAEFKKQESLKQWKINEFTTKIETYLQVINLNWNVLPFISDESIKSIKEQSLKVYSWFSEKEKELFKNDLIEIWFDWNNSFNILDDKDFTKYLEFLIKYPVKSNWKIIEVKEVNWKYDEKSDIFCGTYKYVFEWNKDLSMESLCMNKDWKFLIHK